MIEDPVQAFIPDGSLKNLFRLFMPILFMTFTNFLFLLIEKILLARLSIEAMEAAVNAAYVCQIFQIPCIAIALMTQVCVGRWIGAKEHSFIGPGVWQFIWFSFLSIIITIPTSYLYGHFYFSGTNIETIVKPYYYFLNAFNFLYPLGTALGCFYIGQGKTRLFVSATIISQATKFALAYLLIFGWEPIIPAFGIMGGAISTVLTQGGFCIALFIGFMSQLNAKQFSSHSWHLKPRLLWECINPGILRALNRILSVTCWTSTAHLMTSKGGDYILILSLGGTLFLFLPFIGEALCQAQTTIVSYLLGSKQYALLNKAFHSGIILTLIAILIVAIPLTMFPVYTFQELFPAISLDATYIQKVFFGIWLTFSFWTLTYIPVSYILAFKDTKFSLIMGVHNWINGYLLMYLVLETFQITPDKFWLVHSWMHFCAVLFYYLRMKWLQSSLVPISLPHTVA